MARITIRGVPDQPGIAARLFEPLAEGGISVDTIVENASVERLTDMTFTVSRTDLERAMAVVKPLAAEVQAPEVLADTHLAKVSIVGVGMQSGPGYAGPHVPNPVRERHQHRADHDQRDPDHLPDRGEAGGRRRARPAQGI